MTTKRIPQLDWATAINATSNACKSTITMIGISLSRHVGKSVKAPPVYDGVSLRARPAAGQEFTPWLWTLLRMSAMQLGFKEQQ